MNYLTVIDDIPNNRPPQPSYNSNRSIDPEYAGRLKEEFKEFLAPLKNGVDDLVSETIISWDYSHIVARGRVDSGIRLYDNARRFDDRYAGLIQAENKLINQVCHDLHIRLANYRLPFISLGPGTSHAIIAKDTAIVRALDSSRVNFVEIESETARGAVDTMRNEMRTAAKKVTARAFTADFTKEWPAELRKDIPCFAAMLGGTMGQLNMHEFFKHFNESTQGNALLLFVLNCNRKDPQIAYSGNDFKEFKHNTWHLLSTIAEDPAFNPKAALYVPDFDGEKVKHRYWFQEKTSINIDGENFNIPKGATAITGYSRRPAPESIESLSRGTGMQVVKVYVDHPTQTYGFVMQGKNFMGGDRFPFGPSLTPKTLAL